MQQPDHPAPQSGAAETEHAWRSRLAALGQREDWEAVLHTLDHPPQRLLDAPTWQWTMRGQAMEGLARREEALAAYQQALAVGDASVERLTDQARLLFALHRYAEALNAANQAVVVGAATSGTTATSEDKRSAPQEQRTLSVAWELCGFALTRLGHHRESLAAFERALALDSTNLSAWRGKGAVLLALHHPDEALTVIEQALTLHPKDLSLLEGKSTTLLVLKQPEQALMTLETALTQHHITPGMWYNRGVALYRCKRYEDALVSFEHVEPPDAQALAFMGHTLRVLHRNKEALRRYDQAIALDNENVYAWEGRCVVAFRHGHLREGWKAFRQALRLLLAEKERD